METVQTSPQAAGSARDKILLTAHDLFYLHGIRATGIDKIIAQACVTKVTFYRHFPSKNDLILAYLEYRHARWIGWFSQQLQEHKAGGLLLADALAETMNSWWQGAEFRGCAFLNATAEIGEALADVERLTREHKVSVADVIAEIWDIEDRALASTLVVALDGAIMHAQMGGELATVTDQLRAMTAALVKSAIRQI